MPREIALYNLWSGGSSTNERLYPASQDPLLRALAHPENLGAQLNAIGRTQTYRNENISNSWPWTPSDESDSPAVPKTQEWIQSIEKRFFRQWLRPYLTLFQWGEQGNFWNFPLNSDRAQQLKWLRENRSPSAKALQLKADLEANAAREPRNAFWIVELANWEWIHSPRSFYAPPRSNFALATPFAQSAMFAPVGAPGAPAPVATPGATAMLLPMAAPIGIAASPLDSPNGPYPLPPLVPNEEAVAVRVFTILQRALSCTYFDDGRWPAVREMRRDIAASSSPSLESLLVMLQYVGDGGNMGRQPAQQLKPILWGRSYSSRSVRIPFAPPPSATVPPLVKRVPPQQLLAWSASLAHIARLGDRIPQLAFSRRSRTAAQWLNIAWTLDTPPTANANGTLKFTAVGNAAVFAAKARRLGRPDVAQATLATEQEFSARDALFKKAEASHYILPDAFPNTSTWLRGVHGADALLPGLAFRSSVWCAAIAIAFFLLCPLWMFLNMWLIRSKGQVSSRTSRWLPSTVLVMLLGPLTLWGLHRLTLGLGTMGKLFDTGPPPLALFVGILAVLLALCCAIGTVARHSHRLISQDNDRWHTHLLSRNLRPWVEPLLLTVSALLVTCCGVALALIVYSTGSTSFPVRTPFGVQNGFNITTLVGNYGLVTGTVCFLLWLINWRWPPHPVRPITHTGLRWWKETIGASICVLAWLYLLVALVAWPSRLQAKQMIEERWQLGDWVWLQKNL